ncbi:protein TIFY 5A-like [Pyrus x bretschneideri]|uniref:protein TIFY 5A-like n=1 Tax=Pyrus x bretschneideri TaxID=225117 RepID=UPI0020303DF2|nr:protein TIFY 5A-like [Pyrus x bretschneideri]
MRRNCNLELQLYSPGSNETQQQEHQQQRRRLTIFYNGMMCVRDVTELQARSILFLANKEMEESVKSPFTPSSGSSEPPSPNVVSPLCSTVAGVSMKRSLQRFLQKRKHRTQATSPYHH